MIFNALPGWLIGLFFVFTTPAWAEDIDTVSMDSVEISLLTCQPHDQVYSLYGHTAIRYHDMRKGGMDAAFNYGVFNYEAPFFALRFIFGLTDYELGAFPYKYFKLEYEYFGSMVTEQVLNMTNEEKMKLRLALAENMLPQNKIYRYNFFYNNCTTKARDIIEQCIDGRVEYTVRPDYQPSYRDIVHDMTRQNPWSRCGNDLLLGIKSDSKTTLRQQEFLPNNLMYDFDHAVIHHNGTTRPLVKERRVAVPAGVQMTESSFPLSPSACGLIVMSLGFVLFVIEFRKRRTFIVWDITLMVVTASIGTVLFLMLFSQHPTVSMNLQFILFNPLPWFFLWPAIKGRKNHYWTIAIILYLLFVVGSWFQHYAEGIQYLALCLLLQSYIHTVRIK